MDFYSLTRKELQTLCKKNKIPANITNVAMADALSALPQVEGLDEFLNPTEAEAGAGTPDTHHRTACRTSTRRKALREEPHSVKVVSSQRPQRRTRGGNGDEGGVAEQENKDANVVPVTPAARRRVTAASTRRSKKEAQMVEDDEEKRVDDGKPTDVTDTPAAVPRSRTRATGRSVCPKTEGTSVLGGYNTRRSVRLLEKNLSNISLMDTEDNGLAKNDGVSEEMRSVSQQIEDSADTEEGVSFQTVSNVVSEETDALEVSSLEKKSESEFQVHDSGLEVPLDSGAEIDVGAGLESEPQEEESSLKVDSEQQDSNLKLEGSSETHEDPNAVLEGYDVLDVDMNNPMEVEAAQADHNKAGSELLSELEDSCDSSKAENKECLAAEQEAMSVEASLDVSIEFSEQYVVALPAEVPDDASVEVTDQDDASSLPMSPASDVAARLKEFLDCDEDEVDNKINEADHLEVADGNYIQHFEPMNDVDEKAEDEKDLASPEGVLELGSSDICPSGEHQEEESGVKYENSEDSLAEVEKMDSASDVIIGASSAVASQKDNADANSEDSIDVVEVCLDSSADKSTLQSTLLDDHHEELEAKPQNLEESMAEGEKIIDSASDAAIALEKDASASSENSIAVEVCSAECSADVNNVTLESSLVDVGVQEAEEQKDNSDNLEANAQHEESSEQAAAAEDESPLVDATSDLVSGLNSNTLVESGNAVSEEVLIPSETVTAAKASDIPMQSVVVEQTEAVANETQEAVQKMTSVEDSMHNNNANMKENLMTTAELEKKSMRELKMMMKKLSIQDGKSNNFKSKTTTTTTTNNVVKEVERKRTALQVLPENQMTKGAAQNEA